MNKREIRAEQRKQDEERRKKLITRNWIICVVSLLLAVLLYSFSTDTIQSFFEWLKSFTG